MKKLILIMISGCFSALLFGQNITVELTDTQICEGESVLLNPQVSGGDGNYTYTWSPTVGLSCSDCATPIAAPATSTSYTLLVEDDSGENGNGNINVDVSAVTNTNISETICEGGVYFLEGQVYDASGIYQVVLTGSQGCDSIVTLELTVIPPTATNISVEICEGQTYDVADQQFGISGDYTIALTSSLGCDSIINLVLSVVPGFTLNSIPTNTTCGNDDGAIDLTIAGGAAPFAYSWNNGEIVQDISNLAAGTYTVFVTDNNGCTSSLSAVVGSGPNNLTLNGSVLDVSCSGSSDGAIDLEVVGGMAPYTYSWSPGGITEDLENLAAGTYCVTVTDNGGCTTSLCLTISEPPAMNLALGGNDIIFCAGETVLINATVAGGTAPYVFLWSDGSNTPTIQPVTAGIYCLTVVDANGCEVQDCVTITEVPQIQVNITGPSVIDCPNEEVVLTADVMDGSPGYTYFWSVDGVVISTTQEVTIINIGEVGVIELTVTDANGCSVTTVYVPNITLHIGSVVATPWNCSTSSAFLVVNASGQTDDITYEWFDPEGNLIATEGSVEVTEAGIYTFVLTNTAFSDCSLTASVEVVNFEEIFNEENIIQTLTACNTYELSFSTPINLPTLLTTWGLPDGSTVDGLSVTASETGFYILSVFLGVGECVFTHTVFIDADATACATVDGFVRWDEDEDCVNDINDTPMADWLVTATENTSGQSFSSLTNIAGYYEMSVPTGNYTVTAYAPSGAWEACSDMGMANLPNEGDEVSLDFSFIRLVVCPELSVSLSTPLLRRCFTSTYYLSVCNDGTETAEAPELTLLLDDFLSFNAAAVTPDQIDGQEIHWVLDPLEPNECISFWVSVLVSCDAVLGQTHCSELSATPDPLCAPGGAGWTGANLEVVGDCVNDQVEFRVINTGTGDLTETVNYVIIEDGVMMLQNAGQIDNLASDAQEDFSFPANGSTYTFEVYQAPDHPYTMSLTTSIEGCGVDEFGGFSTGFVTQFATQTASPSSDIFCIENVGSWDPNDKAALPVGYGDQHYIVPETKINYRIRFQNTGTDTAFTVVVRDELSEWLDITTFEFRNASHDYSVDFDAERTLTVVFNNIALPDSTTNLDASQGFFDFSIWPNADIPLGTVVENDAAIYFDFNEPVITNTVFHTVDRNFVEIINWVNEPGFTVTWKVSPNPVISSATLQLEGDVTGEKIILLTDISGKIVQKNQMFGQTLDLDLSELTDGWYGIQLLSVEGKLLGAGKLVKQ